MVNVVTLFHFSYGMVGTEPVDSFFPFPYSYIVHLSVNKILAEPTKVLRQAAELGNEEFLDVVSRIFCLEKERAKVEKIKPGCGSQLNQVSEKATHKE